MFKSLIDTSSRIVVLTGAGVSTDSGIPDFKSLDRSWDFSVSREKAMSIGFFQSNPKKFWEIYRYIFSFKESVAPNDFHYFLSDLESSHNVLVSTQNVDGLHQKAGSSRVVEFHGSADQVLCSKRTCKRLYPIDDFSDQLLPRCPQCRSVLRPNISLFGEGVHGYDQTREEIENANLLIVAGTALNVNPFNQLPLHAQFSSSTYSLWINNDSAPGEYNFDYSFVGSFSEFLRKIVC